jgi:hypothetical protein
MSHGQFPESLPVNGKIPWDRSMQADYPIFRHGGDNGNDHITPNINLDLSAAKHNKKLINPARSN